MAYEEPNPSEIWVSTNRLDLFFFICDKGIHLEPQSHESQNSTAVLTHIECEKMCKDNISTHFMSSFIVSLLKFSHLFQQVPEELKADGDLLQFINLVKIKQNLNIRNEKNKK